MTSLGGLVWLAGLIIGLFDLVFWLKHGYWATRTVETVLGPLSVRDWSGVSQILVWVWSQPLWAAVGVLGIAIVLFGIASDS